VLKLWWTGLLGWALLAVAFADRLGRIDTLLLVAPLVIVPLGLPTLVRRCGDRALPLGSLCAAVAIVVRAGSDDRRALAVAAAAVWLLTVTIPAINAAVVWFGSGDDRFDLSVLLDAAARVFLVVGASWLVLACLRGEWLGFGDTIVLLTAVHFHVAGFGLSTLARHRYRLAPVRSRERRIATAGGWMTILGIPAVAIGHLTVGFLELVGATVMTGAAWCAAGATSLAAARMKRSTDRANILATLLIISALSPVAPMLLALHYGLSRATSIAPLPYDTIALIHGTLNVLGFVGLGLVAAILEMEDHS
jgi:hypothetical protein